MDWKDVVNAPIDEQSKVRDALLTQTFRDHPKDLIYTVKNSLGKRKYTMGFRVSKGGSLLVAWAKPHMTMGDTFDTETGKRIVTERLDRMVKSNGNVDYMVIPFKSITVFTRKRQVMPTIPMAVTKALPKHVDRARSYFKQLGTTADIYIF
jgi:hypothetical protein